MTERTADSLGPIDLLVVGFPPGEANFRGEVIAEIVALADAGTIRVLDLVLLVKGADGTVQLSELSNRGEAGGIEAAEFDLASILAAEDVLVLASAMTPGSVAGVLVYESLWAAPFASAVRRAGGQLIANQRIPIQALIAAAEAESGGSA